MEQTRICFNAESNTRYMSTTIWQNDTKQDPWAVSLEGWNDSLHVTINHPRMPNGRADFADLEFKDGEAFALFASKMFDLYINTFKIPRMEFRSIDFLSLRKGYEKGMKDAREVYIDSKSLDW